jgi:hypothetical protein
MEGSHTLLKTKFNVLCVKDLISRKIIEFEIRQLCSSYNHAAMTILVREGRQLE